MSPNADQPTAAQSQPAPSAPMMEVKDEPVAVVTGEPVAEHHTNERPPSYNNTQPYAYPYPYPPAPYNDPYAPPQQQGMAAPMKCAPVARPPLQRYYVDGRRFTGYIVSSQWDERDQAQVTRYKEILPNGAERLIVVRDRSRDRAGQTTAAAAGLGAACLLCCCCGPW
eukprot:TRINITY_DN5764_c0_g2_i1.p3 TRINITY_DN5764_c0_g2~~TRINITY_DN5764_c0_g2_i1.p3  ORF type:complete len:168 (+),score=40.17 TRINITY_DN5764_c0_g2_i1:60-563(+)